MREDDLLSIGVIIIFLVMDAGLLWYGYLYFKAMSKRNDEK